MSEKFVERAVEVLLKLKKTKVVMWDIKPPFLQDIRLVFKHTLGENQELIDYYSKYVNYHDSLLIKAKKIAVAVNERLTYESDLKNFGRIERWLRPIEIHKGNLKDDCDGYACLISHLLRLFGAHPWESWVWAGYAIKDDLSLEGHATAMVYDRVSDGFYPIEGSLYPDRALNNLGKVQMKDNKNYSNKIFFITNDWVSYTDTPWGLKITI